LAGYADRAAIVAIYRGFIKINSKPLASIIYVILHNLHIRKFCAGGADNPGFTKSSAPARRPAWSGSGLRGYLCGMLAGSFTPERPPHPHTFFGRCYYGNKNERRSGRKHKSKYKAKLKAKVKAKIKMPKRKMKWKQKRKL
jgi:hypothetical protein